MSRRTRPGNPLVGVVYVRVSTDAQTLGPEAQLAAARAFAASKGIAIAAVFTDHGVSGAAEIADRPGLVAALGALRTLGAGALICARRDRIARDVVVAAMVDRAAEAAGARVVCADGSASGDTPADSFMRTVIDGAAAYERELIRSRTRAALQAKKARGERVGTVPYGYRAEADGRLVEDEREQMIIRMARDLRVHGATLQAIVDALAAQGVRSRKGKPLGLAAVHGITTDSRLTV